MFNFRQNVWFRVLARFCDYCLFFVTLGAVTLFLPFFYGPFFYYALALASPVLWVPLEAFFISKWATTPGKSLFGLTVRNVLGFKLSYFAALKWASFLPGSLDCVRQKSISWKRKLLGFAASAAFVFAAIYGNMLMLGGIGMDQGIPTSGWVEYSPSNANFKISFPTDPQSESKELLIPDSGKVLNYEEITSEKKKVSYSVSHIQLPSKWRFAGNTTLLKGVLDVLVKYTGGVELLEKEFRKIGGHRVLDYRLKQEKNEEKGRLIIIGSTLYKLTIVYPQNFDEDLQEDQFLDSFDIS